MAVKRIVINIGTDKIASARAFYCDVLGMKVAMDLGWIMTFVADALAAPQLTVATEGGSGTPVPDISIEVDNLDEMHRRAVEAGFVAEYRPGERAMGCQTFLCSRPFRPPG